MVYDLNLIALLKRPVKTSQRLSIRVGEENIKAIEHARKVKVHRDQPDGIRHRQTYYRPSIAWTTLANVLTLSKKPLTRSSY